MPRLRLAARRAGVLARYAGHEARVVAQIAPPQPPRLLCEAERPLEAEPLQRVRCLAYQAGVEVERGADAHQYRRVEPRPHVRHPLLLQRHAEPHPHDVCASRVDLVGDRIGLGVGELSERPEPAPDYAQARVTLTQRNDEGLTVTATVEVEGATGALRALAGLGHEIRAVDAIAQGMPE